MKNELKITQVQVDCTNLTDIQIIKVIDVFNSHSIRSHDTLDWGVNAEDDTQHFLRVIGIGNHKLSYLWYSKDFVTVSFDMFLEMFDKERIQYKIFCLINKAKDMGLMDIANAIFNNIAMDVIKNKYTWLKEKELFKNTSIQIEKGDDASGHYDLLVLSLNGLSVCCPTPILSDDIKGFIIHNSEQIEYIPRIEHKREAMAFTDTDVSEFIAEIKEVDESLYYLCEDHFALGGNNKDEDLTDYSEILKVDFSVNSILDTFSKYRFKAKGTTHGYSNAVVGDVVPISDDELVNIFTKMKNKEPNINAVLSDIDWVVRGNCVGDDLYPVVFKAVLLPNCRYYINISGYEFEDEFVY